MVIRYASEFKAFTLDVDPIMLDTLWCTCFCARQVLETREGLILPEVDDQMVGELHSLIR